MARMPLTIRASHRDVNVTAARTVALSANEPRNLEFVDAISTALGVKSTMQLLSGSQLIVQHLSVSNDLGCPSTENQEVRWK